MNKNGETRIPNDLFEKIIGDRRLTGADKSVIFAVIRKTIGWQKEEDLISCSQFKKLTNLGKTYIYNTLQKLVKKKIIWRRRLPKGRPHIYKIHPKYWKQLLCYSGTLFKVKGKRVFTIT